MFFLMDVNTWLVYFASIGVFLIARLFNLNLASSKNLVDYRLGYN